MAGRMSNRTSATINIQGVEKRKCAIEIQLRHGFVEVTEPSNLQIQWHRNGKEVQTNKKQIQPGQKEISFNDTFSMNTSLNYDISADLWMPDISILSFLCNSDKVGEFEIDLSNYISKEPCTQTVKFLDKPEEQKHDVKELVGDEKRFPGAYFTIKVIVEPTITLHTPSG